MAKLGFDYKIDTDTDAQGGGGLLPHMYALIWAESITVKDTKDEKGYQVEMTFEVQEPEEFKGRKFWEYWTVVHSDEFSNGSYKYGKPRFDRFGRAVDVNIDADTDTDDLVYKTFTAEIGIEPGGVKTPETPTSPAEYYKDKNKIAKFFYSDAGAKDPLPELGVIGDGTGGAVARKAKPTPANQNQRPAASAAPSTARPAGSKPWASKKSA